MTFRFEANNPIPNMMCRERHRYLGYITSGVVEEYEDNCSMSGKTLTLRVNGTF